MPRTAIIAALVASSLASPLRAAEPDAKQVEFFETKIRPVLVESCYKCHSAAAAKDKKLKGGLLLDSKAGWQKGGDSGAAIVPGKPNEGTLLKFLNHEGEAIRGVVAMPPSGKLPAAVIKDFERWVADGAADPRTDAGTVAKTIDIEKGKQFWSLVPPREPAVPQIRNPKVEIRNEIDRFVHAKWDEKGLTPAPAADKRTILRRVYLDLIGLPPARRGGGVPG